MKKVVKIARILFVCIIIMVFTLILYNTTKLKFQKNVFDTQKVSRRQLAEPSLKSIATETKGNVKTPIYIVDEFLSSTICDTIIEELKSKLKPSTLTRNDPTDPNFRTSSTGLFYKSMTQDLVNKKMSDIILAKKSENPQIQHYDISQEFKAHWDGFDPKHDKEFFDRGQRSWTFMIYLNNVEEGGETHFPNLGETIIPKLGRAVIWYNLDKNGDLDRDTLHQGKPIIKGEKFIITKWFN